MFDFNITAAEIAAYNADMMELAGEFLAPPSDEEMDEMASLFGEA